MHAGRGEVVTPGLEPDLEGLPADGAQRAAVLPGHVAHARPLHVVVGGGGEGRGGGGNEPGQGEQQDQHGAISARVLLPGTL